jgi:hypothetical protein
MTDRTWIELADLIGHAGSDAAPDAEARRLRQAGVPVSHDPRLGGWVIDADYLTHDPVRAWMRELAAGAGAGRAAAAAMARVAEAGRA